MSDFLDVLAKTAQETIDSNYYQASIPTTKVKASLRQTILDCKKTPVITEIKTASPSLGTLRKNVESAKIAVTMQNAGAAGISVLTEPKYFNGSLTALTQARQATKLPILMKDIIIVPEQIGTAAQIGANAVLLILALFDRGCCEISVQKMISLAHSKGLEVLLETHTGKEFQYATETDADLVGINNRNLATLKIDLNTTEQILKRHKNLGKTVISESGIKTPSDIKYLKTCGASAFLIGSSIMLTENIEDKIREFVNA